MKKLAELVFLCSLSMLSYTKLITLPPFFSPEISRSVLLISPIALLAPRFNFFVFPCVLVVLGGAKAAFDAGEFFESLQWLAVAAALLYVAIDKILL